MSTTTTNYGLFKPDLVDPADITEMNPNWDTIDNELFDIRESIENFGVTDLTYTEYDDEVSGEPPEINPVVQNAINNITAEDVGAYPKTGGILDGSLEISRDYGESYPLVQSFRAYQMKIGDKYAATITKSENSSVKAVLGFNENGVGFVDRSSGSAETHILYGDYNKPSGSYTGNGDATSRSIYIEGAVGSTLIIRSIAHTGGTVAIVGGAMGAIGKVNKTIIPFSLNEVSYSNGVLTIATDDEILNESGKTYYWEVL